MWGQEYTPVSRLPPLFIPWGFMSRAPLRRRAEAVLRWLQLCECQCTGDPRTACRPPRPSLPHIPATPPFSMDHAMVPVGVRAQSGLIEPVVRGPLSPPPFCPHSATGTQLRPQCISQVQPSGASLGSIIVNAVPETSQHFFTLLITVRHSASSLPTQGSMLCQNCPLFMWKG